MTNSDFTTPEQPKQEIDDKTIIRVTHDATNPFFIMVRSTAQNKALSFEALGMLAYLLSKPDDWRVQVSDLVREHAGRDKVNRIIRELKDAGHLRRPDQQPHDASGKFSAPEWWIYESPYTEKPSTVQPSTVQPSTVNPRLHNTEKTNKKEKGQKRESARSRANDPLQAYGYAIDWSEVEGAGGVVRRGDGEIVPVSERGAYAQRAIELYQSYVFTMNQLGRLPLRYENLWKKHQQAALTLALEADARITPEAVARYIVAQYKGKDDFWRKLGYPMTLRHVADKLLGWLMSAEASAAAPEETGRDDYYTRTYGKYDASAHRGVHPDDEDMQTTDEERKAWLKDFLNTDPKAKPQETTDGSQE